jgi:2'-5' RNA ligase
VAQPAWGALPINSFAAVCYIPGALGDFLTRLRGELVPGCVARSHVTILPPRPLAAPVEDAERFFEQTVQSFPSFNLDLPSIGTFEETLVVFLSLGNGAREVRAMHDVLNRGPLWFGEPFPFHPHVTVAQGIARDDLAGVREMAYRRWAESGLSNSVLIERATFVQNTAANCWLDLLDCALEPQAVSPVTEPA